MESVYAIKVSLKMMPLMNVLHVLFLDVSNAMQLNHAIYVLFKNISNKLHKAELVFAKLIIILLTTNHNVGHAPKL